RDVHHVRERVVVVLLQRRQRHQRRAVLRDDVGEAVDDLARAFRIGLVARLRLLPQRLGRRDRGAVHAARRLDAERVLRRVLDRELADDHALDASCGEPVEQRRPRPAVGELAEKRLHFRRGHPAMERDLLDLAIPQPANEARERGRPLAEPRVVDDDVVADEPDDERGGVGEVRRARGSERGDGALHQRMLRRVELGGPEPRGQPSNELLRVPAHAGAPFSRMMRRSSRSPVRPASASAAVARVVPMATSASTAAPLKARAFFRAKNLLRRMMVATAATARSSRSCRTASSVSSTVWWSPPNGSLSLRMRLSIGTTRGSFSATSASTTAVRPAPDAARSAVWTALAAAGSSMPASAATAWRRTRGSLRLSSVCSGPTASALRVDPSSAAAVRCTNQRLSSVSGAM